MKRTVNVDRIKAAIEERGTLGKEKLCLETGVMTVEGLAKMLWRKTAPRQALTRERLCKVLNASMDEVFPPATVSVSRSRKSA